MTASKEIAKYYTYVEKLRNNQKKQVIIVWNPLIIRNQVTKK